MPTRNVVLTNHQKELIDTLVQSGRYQNASEVMREGLRLVEQRNSEDALKVEALRQAVAVGVADLATGKFRDIPFAAIEAVVANLGKEAGERAGSGT